MQFLVFGLFVVETIQTVLITHDLFATYAFGWGDTAQLGARHLEPFAVPITNGIVGFIVQIFYAHRLFSFSRSRALVCVIVTMAITQATSAITEGIKEFLSSNVSNWPSVSRTIWLAGSAVCDITIAICMSYYLSRNDNTIKNNRVFLSKFTRLTIETGSLTATIASLELILFLGFRHNNYHITPALTIAKLYANSLVLSLNTRMRIMGARDALASAELLELHFQTANHAASTVDTMDNGRSWKMDGSVDK
jgi:hypothetical protein